jgi:hypothetical protein
VDDGEWKYLLNVGYKESVDLAEPSDRGLHESFSGVSTRKAWIWPDLRSVESFKNVIEALIERKVEIWPNRSLLSYLSEVLLICYLANYRKALNETSLFIFRIETRPVWNLGSLILTDGVFSQGLRTWANARTERRPECGGRAAAKRAVRMTHVGRSAPVTC